MPVNFNKLAIVDFETGGLDYSRQPLSIGMVILDPRRLNIVDNGTFYSKIRPYTDEECPKYGLSPVSGEALAKNKLKMEDLLKAPTPEKVWGEVINFMKYHNIKGNKWDAPIFCGFNTEFDREIVDRLCEGHLKNLICIPEKLLPKKQHKELGDAGLGKEYKKLITLKEPYGFGGSTMFRPFPIIDVATLAFMQFESLREPHKLSLDTIKDFLGFTSEGAHHALVDCLWTAEILARNMLWFRNVTQDTDFPNDGRTFLDIKDYISKLEL